MAPLLLVTDDDWRRFTNDLRNLQRTIVKRPGCLSISTDVWWGLVRGEDARRRDQNGAIINLNIHNNDGEWRWGYYDRLAWTIKCVSIEGRKEGLCELKWAPIMSFHQCGGNVGDNIYVPIPVRYQNRGYHSRQGLCPECVSLWHDEEVLNEYETFIHRFAQRYGNPDTTFTSMFNGYANCTPPVIIELNISCGPAGELRYPSYNSHDNWSYPHYGFLQCYGTEPQLDYQRFIRNKYRAINQPPPTEAFDIQFEEIERLITTERNYFYSSFIQDFFQWYNHSLIKHGQRMIQTALNGLHSTLMLNTRIGIKLPGIHWNASNPNHIRLGECMAGLIQPSPKHMLGEPLGKKIDTPLINGYTKLLWALAAPQNLVDTLAEINLPIDKRLSSGNDLLIPQGYTRTPLNLTIHFTCAEMPSAQDIGHLDNVPTPTLCDIRKWARGTYTDHENKQRTKVVHFSRPGDIVTHVGWAGHQIPHTLQNQETIGSAGLELGIENALASIGSTGWKNIRRVTRRNTYGNEFQYGQMGVPYHSINILRLSTASESAEEYNTTMKETNNEYKAGEELARKNR